MSHKNVLAPGTKVEGTCYTYTIERMLGKGAYGITYLTSTVVPVNGEYGVIDMNVFVTLKEFFMDGRMTRNGDAVERNTNDTELDTFARCFFLEADKLSSLSHPNIVKVLEVFTANNTCYYSMEYISGGSLHDYIQKKNGLPEHEALKYIRQLGSALHYMHEHMMLHLDVKPSNIMLASDGKLTLIDYGLSVQFETDGKPESGDGMGCGTPGYAPLEQSDTDEQSTFDPRLDVYALGATYYKMLTGYKPRPAVEILQNGINTVPLVSKNVSQQSIDAIKAAMQPAAADRLNTVDEFLTMLPGDTANKEKRRTINMSKAEDRKTILLLVASVIIAILSLCMLFL